MSLEILWFVLIAVLWTGFFFLEGFDFGVGILQWVLGKNAKERRTYISAIAPHWDGNEVWLLTAGGAIFAAFPLWYATLFSALYIPFVLLLLALIVRGVCFEFRHRIDNEKWRTVCDIALMVGSLIPAVLTGVAMCDLLIGIPINFAGHFTGNFFDLVRLPALFAGLLSLAVFLTNGALFLALKIEGELADRSYKIARVSGIAAVLLFLLTVVSIGAFNENTGNAEIILCLLSFTALTLSVIFTYKKFIGSAFASIGIATALIVASLFCALFPNVLVSSISPENSLTIWNASSTNYTLKIMSVVAATFVPIVLAYQIWSYWIFHKRISPRNVNSEL